MPRLRFPGAKLQRDGLFLAALVPFDPSHPVHLGMLRRVYFALRLSAEGSTDRDHDGSSSSSSSSNSALAGSPSQWAPLVRRASALLQSAGSLGLRRLRWAPTWRAQAPQQPLPSDGGTDQATLRGAATQLGTEILVALREESFTCLYHVG